MSGRPRRESFAPPHSTHAQPLEPPARRLRQRQPRGDLAKSMPPSLDLEVPPPDGTAGGEGGEGSAASSTALVVHDSSIRLRVAGLGRQFELVEDPTTTLGDLKEEIERRMDLPAPYQRLVAKRKKMDDDTMVLGPTVMEGNTIVSMGIGLENRTKILLLHSPQYEGDKEGIEKLTELMKEVDKVDYGRRSRDMNNKLVQELIIQICCKIDAVETNGSEALRKMRKMTVRKAEEVARKSEEEKRGVDP